MFSAGQGVSVDQFLQATQSALAPLGFTANNTLAAVSSCRDELCQPLLLKTKATWGEAFDLSALAGLTFAGATGMGAAVAHAPMHNGRRRMIFIGAAHIAMDENGNPGPVIRRGVGHPSGACGALMKLVGERSRHTDCPPLDQNDLEYSHMRAHLWQQTTSDLARTTARAAGAIDNRLVELCASCLADDVDYAVVTVVMVHHPNGVDAIVPIANRVCLAGVTSEMTTLTAALL